MKAREVMTAEVAAVSPDTSTRQVARLLVGRGVSAVPVVDDRGAPVGMVSEGDLLGRDQGDREARRDWWLTLLAEGGASATSSWRAFAARTAARATSCRPR